MFLCLYVCMYGTYTNSHFSTDLNQTLHTSPPWSGGGRRYVWTRNSWPLRPFGPFLGGGSLQNHGHKMAAGATVFCDTLISMIPAGVRVTSPTLRCRRRRSHPRQPYIRDSSRSSPNVAEMTSQQTTATASYPLFRRVFASRHGYCLQLGDRAIRHSDISLIPGPVFVTYRKSRPCGRQLRVPTPSVLHCR